MNKCTKCGAEFEGNFCPICGEKRQEEKQCPQCGTMLARDSKFCNNCGYSFAEGEKAREPATKEKPAGGKEPKKNGFFKKAWEWIKAHLKIVIPTAVALVAVIVVCSLIPTFIVMGVNGTYFYSAGGELSDKQFIKLSTGKWEDDEGNRGTYSLSGNRITLKYEEEDLGDLGDIFGDLAEELGADEKQGTIENGVLTIKENETTRVYVSGSHKHEYGDWETDFAPTCLYDGREERKCACQLSEYKTLSATGHLAFSGGLCTACSAPQLKYELSANESYYTVTGLADSVMSGSAIVLSMYNGLPVKEIASEAFKNCEALTDIVLGDKIVSVGAGAFYGCTNLTAIIIPEGVTSIGDSAFSGCSRLNGIAIPEGITSIGAEVFSDCSGLASVEIPQSVASIGDRAFYNCSGLAKIDYKGDFAGWCGIENLVNLVRYGSDGKKLSIGGTEVAGELVIPEGVTSIGKTAFALLGGITELTIPQTVTGIGEDAFAGCKDLATVNWNAPEDCQVNAYAFNMCNQLKTVNIGADAKSFPLNAFLKCQALTNVTVANGNTIYQSKNNCLIESATNTLILGLGNGTIPTDGSVTKIGNLAFAAREGLTEIIVPEKVTEIGNSAFANCSNLVRVTLPNGLTTIERNAFYNCSSLTEITVPKGVTKVEGGAFNACEKLTTVNWNAEQCADVDDAGVFYGSNSLTTVKIGDDVKTVPAYLFEYCKSITSVTIGRNVTAIGVSAFENCEGLTGIAIPDSVTNIGSNALHGCTGLTGITVGSGNTVYQGKGNCLIETATKTLLVGCNKSVIPTDGSVTRIGASAFKNCDGLTEIVIPEGIESIGDYAFYNCDGLTEVTVAGSVENFGQSVFSGCEKLARVTLSEGITELGGSMFSYCESLTEIVIPASLTRITQAFYKSENITLITYRGTKAEWKNIREQYGWNSGFSDQLVIQCTDGKLDKNGNEIT